MAERDTPQPVSIRWTDRSIADMVAIGDYIAQDNPGAAERWIGTLSADVERAALFPHAGRVVPEFQRADVREVLRGRYRIVYQVLQEDIAVLTIFEGHRQFPRGVVPEDVT